MHAFNRREFLRLASIAAAAAALPRTVGAAPTVAARVVVVGGGFGGASVAKYLRIWGADQVRVTLVEPSSSHVACILSNLVVTGALSMDRITLGYSALKKRGVIVEQAAVTAINYGGSTGSVSLSNGKKLAYDHLVLAPGIDFVPPPNDPQDWDPEITPHAWKAGLQTLMLKQQLAGMRNGDTFVLTVPKSPYRCPPGPYERACVVADYLKRKQRSLAKVVVLDANAGIQAEPLAFEQAFNSIYRGMIEYIPNATVSSVNSQARTIVTSAGTWSNVRVLNYIPNQRAAAIGPENGGNRGLPHLNAQGFVPVDALSYAVSGHPNVHVIGDACAVPASEGKGVPKSGHMANAEAKVCADAILRALKGEAPDSNVATGSACFSPITAKTASWLSGNFNYGDIYDAAGKVKGKGMHRVDLDEAPKINGDNYEDMFTWAEGLFADSFV
ncbi:FAD/NAD(P)-binding oxidoreductase [Candidatus Accumulibacter sp. ACC003]|uniref:FAD-dependent oxidoreductase n=1 Tax=Candidatus Accumulibacter sp. ACC003 TaxID=2823334 RepID=UPI0025C4D671|nr:FAD/NAD(P)-binding oxidoreductase [Candidatus Accumulibacter sp. ACC003]